jgi:hypothetical protein
LTAAPALSGAVRRKLAYDGLGDVFFCRVSDAKLLPVARSIYPRCIASHEPRPGFHGITFCGANATISLPWRC